MMRRFLAAFTIAFIVIIAGCLSVTPETGTPRSTAYQSTTSTTPSSTPTPSSSPATWTNPLVNWENATVSLPSQDAELSCQGILWRYILKDALECMLSREELGVISPLAENLKGEELAQSAWNVLAWEGEWLSYDWEKAKQPFAKVIIYPDGREEVVEGQNNTIQTPYETIMRRTGICTDYTVLTDALLLALNYSPVYAMAINLTDLGHATALVKINGWYFALDQHLPPMDLGAYYRYWERQGSKIINATLYEITPGEEKATVKVLGLVTGEEFLNQDYTMGDADARNLAISMMNILYGQFGLKADESLKSLSDGKLPEGYKAGWTWGVTYYNLADYYHPFFHEEYAEWLVSQMLSNREFLGYVQKSDSVWIEVRIEGEDLILTIYLGSS
ncbi:transglutaminase-like domain-containing protein [Thermococcus thermotolerans]|uniref:transglutaminase-like domain-containing protein n=1 Tax=Thermococcus thermotolerans TaxID=2969672 RepID=UPI00215838C0|nr:transglutaminase-like domain-containing protein [Thermococcus thermotolerans]